MSKLSGQMFTERVTPNLKLEEPDDFLAMGRQEYDHATRVLGAAKNIGELKDAMKTFHHSLDSMFVASLAAAHVDTIACRPGCCYCCYIKVDVMPVEAFIIVDAIRAKFAKKEQEQVKESADENHRKIAPLSADEHMRSNIPCPLLKDGKCSVYACRPSLCRRFHAVTHTSCEQAFGRPDLAGLPDEMVPEVSHAVGILHWAHIHAFESLGYDSRPYDLNAALVETMGNNHCERRWRDKKKAFSRMFLAKDYVEDNASAGKRGHYWEEGPWDEEPLFDFRN